MREVPIILQHIVLKVKPSGMHAHQKPYCAHIGYQCRATIGQEWERNSGNRHYTHDHADIQAEMVKVHAQYAGDNQDAKPVAVFSYDGKTADENREETEKQDESSRKSGFFGDNAEYEVRALFREETVVALGSLQKPPAPQAARTNRYLGLYDVPSCTERITGWVYEDYESLDLVRLEYAPGRNREDEACCNDAETVCQPVIVLLPEHGKPDGTQDRHEQCCRNDQKGQFPVGQYAYGRNCPVGYFTLPDGQNREYGGHRPNTYHEHDVPGWNARHEAH